jgi:hypothetical protein
MKVNTQFMKKIWFLLTLLLMVNMVNAQGVLKHSKKVYKAPDGKLYIQKALPIYFYLSTESDQKGTMGG